MSDDALTAELEALNALDAIETVLDPETAEAWAGLPVIVRDRYLTVLAANEQAVALSPDFAPGSNIARVAFLPSRPREAGATLAPSLGNIVAILRHEAERHPGDEGFVRLIGELAALSVTFSTLWADDGVVLDPGVPMSFPHPGGEVEVVFEESPVPAASGLVAVAMHPVSDRDGRHEPDRDGRDGRDEPDRRAAATRWFSRAGR